MAPNRIAIIGAGISGVVTAAHLKNAGFSVTVFERAKVTGGVWYAYQWIV
jgi:ACS family pantothenate transporter-like MFS transporter